MESTRHLRALGRAWWVIIVAIFAGGMGGYGLYEHTVPEYRATAQFVVGYAHGQLADEVSARLLAAQRAGALVQLAPTDPVVHAAVVEAGIPNAHPSVSANGGETSSLFTVTVTDTNGAAAAAIANAYRSILLPQLVTLVGPLDSKVRLQTVNPAVTPTKPFSPNKIRDLGLGLLSGLILGIAVALLMDVLSRTLRDSDEIAEVTDLTVLGTVPRHEPRVLLPAHTHPRSVRSEAYRQVRTTLLNLHPPLNVVAVTSPVQGEGKTSVAANLATTIRRAGHSVIMVDADLRRSKTAQVFDLPKDVLGLADVLSGAARLHDVIQELDEGLPAVLPAGRVPANPSELLASQAFVDILAELRGRYEYVLLDTTPVLPVTDSLVVAPLVDGVMLVARVGRTTSDRLVRALDGLNRVQANVIGVIPNCAAPRGADRYYRYGYASTQEAAPIVGRRAAEPGAQPVESSISLLDREPDDAPPFEGSASRAVTPPSQSTPIPSGSGARRASKKRRPTL